MPSRRALLAALSLTTAAAGLTAAPAGAQSAPPSAGLRVATFNTYLLSPGMRCLPHLVSPESASSPVVDLAACLASDSAEQDAAAIAQELLAHAGDYDVLALNEVWDEDARRIIVQALEAEFPHHVSKIDLPLVQTAVFPIPDSVETFKLNLEDSGLMLFARSFLDPEALPGLPPGSGPMYLGSGYDRLPLPPTGLLPLPTVEGTIAPVGFTGFGDACEIDDCYAGKGAGLVRFRDTRSGERVNVVFTHMQAEVEHAGARERQLEAVRRLVDAGLGPAASRELLLVMGDLNVRGEDQVIRAPGTVEGTGEWSDRFGDPTSWAASAVHDTWALTTSEQDRGITHDASGERLDYILASHVGPGSQGWTSTAMRTGRCIQQTTIEMVGTPSDHRMVRADINRPFHYCSPRAAWLNPPVDVPLGANPAAGSGDTTQIRFPGSVQWLHVVDPSAAAYEIGHVQGSMPVEVTVYAPDDLTNPIAPYRREQVEKHVAGHREPMVGTQYVLPPEFYVRLRSEVPGATGDIRPVLHRMRCDSIEDACPMDAASPQLVTFPGATPLGADDTAWLRLDVTQQADSGVAQQVQVVADQLDPERFSVDVVDVADPWGASPFAATVAADGVTHDVPVAAPGSYLLRISRHGGPDGTPRQVRAGWTTDLQVMEVRHLTCIDETNGFLGSEAGHDEIDVQLGVDGVPRWLTGGSGGWIEFDCDNRSDPHAVTGTTLRFLGDVTAQVWEIDDGSPNDSSQVISLATHGATLARDQQARGGRLRWEFEGGEYAMGYELRRRPNAPVV